MRILAAGLIALVMSLAACGGSDEPVAEEKPANPDCKVNFRACAI